MKRNLLIIHGGGPTAVINHSLYGAVEEAKEFSALDHIYAARNGTGGLLREELIDIGKISEERLRLIKNTPGSAIGTSRDILADQEYSALVRILNKNNIAYVLMNGGNGTMDTCGKLYRKCRELGQNVSVIGIPKTMDNDLSVTDHSPGYGSAARYMAHSVREVCADVKGLPIHVVVVEASGRNAGWVTAASALAAVDENGETDDGFGPDLIYLPERDFEEDAFISDVSQLLKRRSGIVVVASEGLHKADGKPIVKPVFSVGRSTYFGDVSSHLANLVIQKLGYKARGEKPGLLGRASVALRSSVDCREAEEAGRAACRAAMAGESGKMVAFRRLSNNPYKSEVFLVDIEKVMMRENVLPASFINEAGNGMTKAFFEYACPLVECNFPQMLSLNDKDQFLAK